jgi:hypothetical protein
MFDFAKLTTNNVEDLLLPYADDCPQQNCDGTCSRVLTRFRHDERPLLPKRYADLKILKILDNLQASCGSPSQRFCGTRNAVANLLSIADTLTVTDWQAAG